MMQVAENIANLITLDDVSFLKAIVARYPETIHLIGKAAASPEGRQHLKADAISYKVFDNNPNIDPSAIEADRTLVGLLLLKDAINGDKTKFSHLSEESFAKLHAYTNEIITSDADLEFCLYSLACNDLGKTQTISNEFTRLNGWVEQDHDQLLAVLAARKPDLFQGLQNHLDAQYQKIYSESLNANFNLGQFVQAEMPEFNVTNVRKLSKKCRDLRLLVEVFDFAGAAGHTNNNASELMDEDNFFAFFTAIHEVTNSEDAYKNYLKARAKRVGLEINSPENYALARLVCMNRIFDEEGFEPLQNAWASFPQNRKQRIIEEFNKTGFAADKAILLYYSPAVFANSMKHSNTTEQGISMGLALISDTLTGGVVSVNISHVAKAAAQKQTESFASKIEGNTCAFIGIGGGSDGVQASILAELSGKPSCVISIRRGNRNVQNHNGEIEKGVFLITPQTTASGRSLEHLYSHKFKSYIVEDYENGELTNQIAAAMAHFGKVDTLYAVDTGGDALYKTTVDVAAVATPDQDLASLDAISQLKAQKLYSVIIANGVDAPPYAAQVLADSKANQIFLSPDEAQKVLQIYRDYHLDGTDNQIFGKTCYAWQAALEGKRGNVILPLPRQVVNDPTNPWNPIVNITDEMAGIYVMSLKRHLAVLNDKQDILNIDTNIESSLSL